MSPEDEKLMEDLFWAALYKDRVWFQENRPRVDQLAKRMGGDEFVAYLNSLSAKYNEGKL